MKSLGVILCFSDFFCFFCFFFNFFNNIRIGCIILFILFVKYTFQSFKEGEALIIDVLVLPDVFPTFEEEGFVCVLDLVVVLPVVAEDGISFVNSFNDLDDIECLI